MIDRALFAVTFVSALGSGLVAGTFFAFSAFVMKALDRIPPGEGMAAMRSINVAVLNPLFFAAFLGTAAATALLVAAALLRWSEPGAGWLVASGLIYLIGTFLVTIAFNVPLNYGLADVRPDSADGAAFWVRYLADWTLWNHVRTLAALVAAASLTVALCLQFHAIAGA